MGVPTLNAGVVRDRLESLGERIGLRFRDILLWKSGGVMVNAAVMGIFAPVRYVLLSDALLSGMTPEQVDRIFDKFYRADASNTAVGGLGLGMNISKQIVEAHGGKIKIVSREVRGIDVMITLPVNQGN